MKSALETLAPTRVKLTVEVPFAELEPAITEAYRKVGRQVRIKGFRPGKVPPRLLDQYVGRGAVLEEAVNEAVPGLYGDAVREQDIEVLGHPDIELTKLTDGEELVFTAEVDVRPEITLPDYDGLPVTVDDIVSTDDEVTEQMEGLRDRYGIGTLPRTVNLITGPSRSADIEQTLILGAHGPRKLHVIVVGEP